MKKVIFIVIITIILAGVGGYLFLAPYHEKIIFLRGVPFFAEVADTPAQWQRGLSHRKELCARCAMVFVFDEPQVATFWMKDMQFDIDILWARGGDIIHTQEYVSHTTPRKTYTTKDPVDTVIELPAGSIARYHLMVQEE